MTDTTTAPPARLADATPPTGGTRRRYSTRTTAIVATVMLALMLALLVLLILSTPVEDPAKIVIPGFSLTALFQWLGAMNPLVQIPIILVIFAAVVGIILVLIEFAPRPGRVYFWIRLVACFAIPVLALMLLRPYQNAFIYVFGIAVLAGAVLFWLDYRSRQGAGYLFQLVLFAAPAVVLLLIGLIYPFIATFFQSFYDKTGDQFVGMENYVWVFTQPEGLWSVVNTLIWVLVCPTIATVVGLAYAAFIDRARGEKFLKVLIFMPFAISFVGAGIIWKFVYDYRATEQTQIGLLNAMLKAIGVDTYRFLLTEPFNTMFLIIIFVWVQAGFAMTILSASIKAIPTEITEAAKLDGVSGLKMFRYITVPSIRPALIVVLTTISIATLKVFDIVRTTTGGNFGTSVLANEFYTQSFRAFERGLGSALGTLIFVLVMPIVIYNVRQMRKLEAR